MISLSKLTTYLDRELRHSEIQDYPGAYNGLQLENNGKVSKIAAAVDSHAEVLKSAAALGADFLLVHHGLWWNDPRPVTGISYQKISQAIQSNLAVYGSHLPLDLHPRWGNNAVLAQKLGFKKTKPFLEMKGNAIGVSTETSLSRSILHQKLEKVLGNKVHLIAGGPAQIRRIGIVSGGAGNDLEKAKAEGLDTFITGEGSHWTYGSALELSINLFYGGHYATEVFGVQTVAKHLSHKFKVPWVWIDSPSGL
ncbi:MAG: Nif3-like dinuclear metal center hexameric protein [Verrucomicrobiota bacterium]